MIRLWQYILLFLVKKPDNILIEYIKPDLIAMNYTILSDRPLTAREKYENFEFEPDMFRSTILKEYIWQIKRLFIVRNEKGHDFEIVTTIVQTWRGKIRYRIDNTSRIRN
jgi:hypothetical protein